MLTRFGGLAPPPHPSPSGAQAPTPTLAGFTAAADHPCLGTVDRPQLSDCTAPARGDTSDLGTRRRRMEVCLRIVTVLSQFARSSELNFLSELNVTQYAQQLARNSGYSGTSPTSPTPVQFNSYIRECQLNLTRRQANTPLSNRYYASHLLSRTTTVPTGRISPPGD